MAGTKGRSGGARQGAGRPAKEPETLDLAMMHKDPKAFLLAVMNDAGSEAKTRVDAAKALMPYMHKRLGEAGKKEEAADAAKKAGNKFAVSTPPSFKVVGGSQK